MKRSSSNISLAIIAVVVVYFLSPPLVVKFIDNSPLRKIPNLEKILGVIYYPAIIFAKHHPPYRKLLNIEAEALDTHL